MPEAIEEAGLISPSAAVLIFSMGTGALGAVANIVLASRLEEKKGMDIWMLVFAVIAASALNIFFASMLPVMVEDTA